MRQSTKDKLLYKFEKFIAKGGVSIFLSLILAFVTCYSVVVIFRWGLHYFVVDSERVIRTFADHLWATFLEMTDPGNMIFDTESSRLMKVPAIISGLLGVIIFSTLIAFITTAFEKALYEFRKGRGKVMESGHTLILGWNDRVFDIIRELVLANESEKYVGLVVLSNKDKEEMDDAIYKQITDSKTTSIVTRSGSPASINELKRVNASLAKSVIILTNCLDNASVEDKQMSDNQVVKTIMALISSQDGKNKLPIIAEMFNEEQRNLLSYFNDEKIISIDTWSLMGKLLLQTSLSSGLERVYYEMLSFAGNEIYFYKTNWEKAYFYELSYHFLDGIPLGIYKPNGELILRPAINTQLEADDEILILAKDDSTIKYEPELLFRPDNLTLPSRSLAKSEKKILILGWHDIGAIYIKNSLGYIREQSVFDIMFDGSQNTKSKIRQLQEDYSQMQINFFEQDPMSLSNLRSMNPFNYDKVIILSRFEEERSAEKTDADTIMMLLLLRKISLDIPEQSHKTKIITQVLNSENQEILIQTDVDDFITSNKLITMVLSQLSEEPKLKKFYDDIFEHEGSEIYLKPCSLYFHQLPVKVSFCDISACAIQREEICLGVRLGKYSRTPTKNFGVQLNPKKDAHFELTKDDYLIVLAEDEL